MSASAVETNEAPLRRGGPLVTPSRLAWLAFGRNSRLEPQGFSQTTCLPAWAAFTTHSLLKPVGNGM